MRRFLFLFLAMALLPLTGCEQLEPVLPHEEDHVLPDTRSMGDGKYDVLGYGMDATRATDDLNAYKFSVIDIEKLLQHHPDAIEEDAPKNSDNDSHFGVTSEEFLKEITVDFHAKGGFRSLFSAELTSKYSSSVVKNIKNSFARHEEKIVKSRQRLKPEINYTDYLSEGFKSNLQSRTATELVRIYGTHVMTGVELGAKLHVVYKCEIKSGSKTSALKAGLSSSLANIFGVKTTYEQRKSHAKRCENIELHYKTLGGDPKKAFSGKFSSKAGSSMAVDLSDWIESVDESTFVCVGIPDDHLISIWEFISSPGKRREVKAAAEAYIKSRQVRIDYPLYMYTSGRNSDHRPVSYTDHGDTWDGQPGGYALQGLMGYLASPYEDPELIKKVYRYFAHSLNDTYLTTTNMGLKGTRYGHEYSENGYIGYIYTKPTGDYIHPIYILWKCTGKNARRNHIYTTDKVQYDNLGKSRDWEQEGILGYIRYD